MIRFRKNDFVDVELYDAHLNRTGYILYDREAAQNILDYLKCRAQTLASRAIFVMKLRSGCMFFSLHKEAVHRYLVVSERCPERYFINKRTKGVSLDMKRVLEKLRSNGYAKDFLDRYMEHRSLLSKHNSMNSIVKNCQEKVGMDINGHSLCKIGFIASQQKNLRFNYRKYDIISQLPKEALDTISAEQGYFLAWGDFAQSDFRVAYNLFIRSEENDRIMNQYADKYEALSRIVKKAMNQEFNLEQFQQERPLYKRLTLATMYGMRTSPVTEEQNFIKVFTEFLQKCPKYAEYYRRLQELLLLRSPIEVISYFGHSEFIDFVHDKQAFVNDALNSPVQTGTSELVILTVNSILEQARRCGLSADQFGIYITRHDEPVFRISKDAINFLWILKQHSVILVDDWTPLSMEFNFGYHYKISDPDLHRKAEEVYKDNTDKISQLKVGTKIDSMYYPIKPLFNLRVHWISIGQKTIVTFYEGNSGKALFSLLDTTETSEIIKCVRLKISDAEQTIREHYSSVLVRSNFFEGNDFFGNTYVVYQYEKGPGMDMTIKWCKFMLGLYCSKNHIPLPDEYLVKDMKGLPPQLEVLLEQQEVAD